MLLNSPIPDVSPIRKTIRDNYRTDESRLIEALLPVAEQDIASRTRVQDKARALIESIRRAQLGKGGIDALLNEFSLSTEEGIVLMCLAEALLRVPDKHNVDCLIQDKLAAADWASHLGNSGSLFVNASAWGLLITGKLVNYNQRDKERQTGLLKRTVGRLGEPVIRQAVRYALQMMGTQFVLGGDIQAALQRARKQEARGYGYSYDMLGEAARTAADAARYFRSYMAAIEHIGTAAAGRGPVQGPGISVKLSAIHPRYQFVQRQRVMDELVPRLKQLVMAAKSYAIGFTVDAEEADRLDLSLDVIEAVFTDPDLEGWDGFGIAVQAYQKRALYVVEWANQLATRAGRKLMLRLVKGAYWDTEIKLAQAEGYRDYPVFTSKPATDVSYQACARKLLQYRDRIYPQFATHNAYTVATILEMAGSLDGFEFQRLHGMGQALYDHVLETEGVACRIYAPVGEHADLLAYLVRRLLENGANSSFVNNIVDASISVDSLLLDPVETVRQWPVKRNLAIALPEKLYGTYRSNSRGLDITDVQEVSVLDAELDQWWKAKLTAQPPCAGIAVRNPSKNTEVVGYHNYASAEEIDAKLDKLHRNSLSWSAAPVSERASILLRLAEKMELQRNELLGLCVKEAGKNLADSIAEVREAIDFCFYYANQARSLSESGYKARGVVLCISPWNFPLAIFIGQVSAALVAGNTVLAKPAEQTSLIAQKAIDLALSCGLPEGVVEIVVAPGRDVGPQVIPDSRIRGVMFTGSTQTGKWIAQALARRSDGPIPLVAETGGQNAMIVDSTALPEQVVDDVIRSGFQSAGQRCSALRVLFLQQDIAPKVIEMIKGAMAELKIGDPAKLNADVGPVIDETAKKRLQAHLAYMQDKGELLYSCELPEACSNGYFFAPRLYEIKDLSVLRGEVFGPVVHIVRFRADALDEVIDQINSSGFGLTLGVHSRIQFVRERVAQRSRVGNVYINRNMIGAVVGVQPFGGHGLSGTGPKAGGPHYLSRLVQLPDKTVNKNAVAKYAIPQTALKGLELKNVSDVTFLPSSWTALSIDERVEKLQLFLSTLNCQSSRTLGVDSLFLQQLEDSAQEILAQTRQLLNAPMVLPGPTGESNKLVFESRGLLLNVLSDEDDLCDWLLGIVAALATGNRVLCLAQQQAAPIATLCRRWIMDCEIDANVLEVADFAVEQDLETVMNPLPIDGVLLTPDSKWEKQIERALAERSGTILPLIGERVGSFYLYRFLLEKSISEDTTASGGNASLMTLGDIHAADEKNQAVPMNLQQTG